MENREQEGRSLTVESYLRFLFSNLYSHSSVFSVGSVVIILF
jgi:hypothetical protein